MLTSTAKCYTRHMKYERVSWEAAVYSMADKVNKALEEGTVLLLLSGGSNVKTAVALRERLAIKNELTVGLTDERYSEVGHSNSNWTAMLEAGFNTDKIKVLPVLEGEPVEETTENYKDKLRRAFQAHASIIGLFGLGADGHTSGILPGSPAVESTEIVMNYQAADYQRITTTPVSFRSIDTAFLVAYGENKKDPLEHLSVDVPIAKQPAQALKFITDLTIYNDQVGQAGEE